MHFRARFRLLTSLGAIAVVGLVAGGIAMAASSHHHRVFRGKRTVLAAAQIRRLSAGAKKRTIIIFKNQLSGLPARGHTAKARASAASASQAAVRTDLARVHATHVHSFQIINAISASVTSAEAQHLRVNPSVARSCPTSFVISPRWAAVPARRFRRWPAASARASRARPGSRSVRPTPRSRSSSPRREP